MKKKLNKPGLNHAAKSIVSLYASILNVASGCKEPGGQYSGEGCKGSKCCNGAGGC